MERVIFRFAKGEAAQYVGHLDLMRVFERAMRRSRFPVAYTQGFNPRPRMAFASALTAGATSADEICQVDLAGDLEEERLDGLIEALRAQLPEGLQILGAFPATPEKRSPWIQATAAQYELTLEGEAAAAQVEGFFSNGPGIPACRHWSVQEPGPDRCSVQMVLPIGEREGVRIREVIATLEAACPGIRLLRLHRARLWCTADPPPDFGSDSAAGQGTGAGDDESERAAAAARAEAPAEPAAPVAASPK